jgi:hypothetical protein
MVSYIDKTKLFSYVCLFVYQIYVGDVVAVIVGFTTTYVISAYHH